MTNLVVLDSDFHMQCKTAALLLHSYIITILILQP